MTRSAFAIRHVAFESLGLLEPLLTDRGFTVEYRDAGIDHLNTEDVHDADLLIILGAPVSVNDTQNYPFLFEEVEIIKARLEAQKPVLGICLGAQQIAVAAGAEVRSMGLMEIGYTPVELTEAGANSVLAPLGTTPVLHWHSEEFSIPTGSATLASTPDFDNQAFTLTGREGTPFALALQFHLEVDPRRIEQWLIAYSTDIEAAGLDVGTIRREALIYGDDLTAAANSIFSNWLDAVNL